MELLFETYLMLKNTIINLSEEFKVFLHHSLLSFRLRTSYDINIISQTYLILLCFAYSTSQMLQFFKNKLNVYISSASSKALGAI